MTEFTDRVVQLISLVPPGKVASYGMIAAMAGNPRAARQVSRILHSMSAKYSLPWHRIVNSKGRISLPEGGGKEEQIFLLDQEGIKAGEEGKIDLQMYLWRP